MSDTETLDEAPEQPALPGPAPAPATGWPTWLRRSVIGIVLVAALGVAIWGSRSASSSGDGEFKNGAIVALSPIPDAQALRQTAVGADLAVGWDGRLTVNGIDIPEAEMVGARDPATVDPADLAQNGLRANNRNTVYFKPGPGKVIESFEQGTVTITLRYYRDGHPESSDTRTWTIRVA